MTHKASSFNLNRIFVDTNVLVGGYSGDVRFQKDADCLHYLYSLTGKRLYVSSLSVAQLISVYQKKKKNDEIEPELAFFTKGGQYERDAFNPNGNMTSYFSVRYVKE